MVNIFNFVYLGSLILRIYLSRLFRKLKMFQFLKEYPLNLIYNERKKMKMYASYATITITSEVSSNQKVTQAITCKNQAIEIYLESSSEHLCLVCYCIQTKYNFILNILVSHQQFLKKSCLSTWRLMGVNVYFIICFYTFVCILYYTFYSRYKKDYLK